MQRPRDFWPGKKGVKPAYEVLIKSFPYMVRLWEILPSGEEVELLSLTEAEQTLIVLNPELAPELGLAWAATKLWERYGDHIQKWMVEQTTKGIQRMKNEFMESGRPRKQTKLPYKQKKRRAIEDTDEKSPESDLDEKMDEAENPPPPDSMAAIPQMGKWTSYPTTTMCVDLGTLNLNPKPGSFIDDTSITGNWTMMRNTYYWHGTAQSDKRLWQNLTECGVTMDNSDHLGVAMGNDGGAVRHHMYPRPTLDETYRNCSFNSALSLLETLRNLPVDSAGDAATFTWPVPNGQVYTNDFYETNSAYQLVGLRNQFVELHIKNMSGSVFDFLDSTEDATDKSPMKTVVRVIQAKENILVDVAASNTIANVFNAPLASGFTRSNDLSLSDDPLKPVNSSHQKYQIFYGDNGYLSENWEIVDKKEFCLCPGQEGTLKIGLPKNQVISFKYLLEAEKGTLVSGTVGTNGIWRMKTPIIKKGEQHVLVEFHGGVGVAKSAALEAPNMKPVSAAFYWTHSYEFCYLTSATNTSVVKTIHNAKPVYTDYTDDLHIGDAAT